MKITVGEFGRAVAGLGFGMWLGGGMGDRFTTPAEYVAATIVLFAFLLACSVFLNRVAMPRRDP